MTDLNTPERVKRAELDVPQRSAGTALPMFPPKPEDTVRGPLIVSALPAELPRSLRAAVAPIPVVVPVPEGHREATDRTPPAPKRSAPWRRRPATPRPGEGPTSRIPAGDLPGAPPESDESTPPAGSWWRRRSVQGGAAVVVLAAVALPLLLSGADEPVAPPAAPPPAAVVGEFDFQRLPETAEPIRDSDCTTHAYGRTKEFLTANRCLQLTRAVYSTTFSEGRTVYTSVSVVRMRTDATAAELTDLVRQEGTGSVTDLLRDGVVVVPDLDRLSRGGFAAAQSGRDVVIVESDTTDRGTDPVMHKAAMKRVSLDAVRLGAELR